MAGQTEIQSLPVELLEKIGAYLAHADRTSLLLLSKYFFRVVEPTLYEELHLSDNLPERNKSLLDKLITQLELGAVTKSMYLTLSRPRIVLREDCSHGIEDPDSIFAGGIHAPDIITVPCGCLTFEWKDAFIPNIIRKCPNVNAMHFHSLVDQKYAWTFHEYFYRMFHAMDYHTYSLSLFAMSSHLTGLTLHTAMCSL